MLSIIICDFIFTVSFTMRSADITKYDKVNKLYLISILDRGTEAFCSRFSEDKCSAVSPLFMCNFLDICRLKL